MTPERRAEIASLGGRTTHAQGKAHRFTSETASKAGKAAKRRNKFTSEQARAAGSLGGRAVHAKRRAEQRSSAA